MKRGSYVNCKNMLKYLGYSEDEAEVACSKYLQDQELGDTDEFNLMFTDDDEDNDEEIDDKDGDKGCVSRKIHIFSNEHPDWSHNKVVAAAMGYCGLSKKDAINPSGIIPHARNISLSKFSSLIKTLRTKTSLKVGAMGIIPNPIERPMKNLNRLQTKLEKIITQEQKFLTSEAYEQRKQYARYMRKTDSEELSDSDYVNILEGLYNDIIAYYPELSPEDAIDKAFEPEQMDNAWILSNEAEIVSFNDGLNNIIKAPVILAKEMVQPYTLEDGTTEYHFKPYDELKEAIDDIKRIGSLDIIIEHQDFYDDDNIIGVVKEFRADSNDRSIKGMAYFRESKLPDGLKQMIQDGEIIPVSIGFLAKLGSGGEWMGQKYQHIQRNIILRHLAVCLDSVARCPPGVCGINLGDAFNNEYSDNKKIYILKNKESYYYNICNIIRDSKKETNKELSKNIEEIEAMQKDSNKEGEIAATEPDDLEAMLKRLRMFMAGVHESNKRDNAIARILSALGIKSKSDSNMDEKEFNDALKIKDETINNLSKELSDSKKRIEELESAKRIELMKNIRKFGKYSEEELVKMEKDSSLNELSVVEDAVKRFQPSDLKPEPLPVGAKDDKKKMEDELDKPERIDPYRVFDDVKDNFDMSGF